MHPELSRLFRQLANRRLEAGLTVEQVERRLVLGPGWVEAFEGGDLEPTIGTLAALLHLYGTSLPKFFADLDLAGDGVVMDRHLTATQEDNALRLHFPMGPYKASITIPDATVKDFNSVVEVLRDKLADGQKAEGIAASFLRAVRLWPHANSSDLWYFLVAHAYQDDYNHPASTAGTEWAQSWKRASGWAFEVVVVEHYNPHLQEHGITLALPSPQDRVAILQRMGVPSAAQVAEKADVIAIGQDAQGAKLGLGVLHFKVSFAERRTDDVPLSQQLIARGYASPLVTMDCKASPSVSPVNKGELGAVQGGEERVSAKRFDMEREKKFDACFSFNKNTRPTPPGQEAAARIHVVDFSDPDDALSKHLISIWRSRQGLG